MTVVSQILKKFISRPVFSFVSPSGRDKGGVVNKAYRNRIKLTITQSYLDMIYTKSERVNVNVFLAEFNRELYIRESQQKDSSLDVFANLVADVYAWDFDDMIAVAIDCEINKHSPKEYGLAVYQWSVSTTQINLELSFKRVM